MYSSQKQGYIPLNVCPIPVRDVVAVTQEIYIFLSLYLPKVTAFRLYLQVSSVR